MSSRTMIKGLGFIDTKAIKFMEEPKPFVNWGKTSCGSRTMYEVVIHTQIDSSSKTIIKPFDTEQQAQDFFNSVEKHIVKTDSKDD